MASKRKFDDMLENDWKEKPITTAKHSLDSDEEDDDEINSKTYDVLDDDEIEGQEEGIAGIEGGIQMTPFNMKEEMEEGHFDADGMYHWSKEKQVRDNWLENIDWVKIHNKKGSSSDMNDENSIGLPDAPLPEFEDNPLYKEMLTFMKPKETVAKALRRIAGNQNISSAERWKRKKAGIDTSKEEEESKQNVAKLTELANTILQNKGNMDIYQESYEYISEKVNSVTKSKAPVVKVPELDMYADDFDLKEKEKLETRESGTGMSSSVTQEEKAKPPEDSGDVMWEFKWEKDSAEVSGPHSSEEMLKWCEEGKFKKEVWVRKCGQDGDFYTSKRIDFDLYI